ncbi:unnamed protein product [Somion occarium]|uniref:Uncharacterized protein n=1 Tax=Somion occarium TaxID=3059160 RepID=A0ABP1DM30_9APHY
MPANYSYPHAYSHLCDCTECVAERSRIALVHSTSGQGNRNHTDTSVRDNHAGRDIVQPELPTVKQRSQNRDSKNVMPVQRRSTILVNPDATFFAYFKQPSSSSKTNNKMGVQPNDSTSIHSSQDPPLGLGLNLYPQASANAIPRPSQLPRIQVDTTYITQPPRLEKIGDKKFDQPTQQADTLARTDIEPVAPRLGTVALPSALGTSPQDLSPISFGESSWRYAL